MVCRATTLASIYGDGLLKGETSFDDAIASFTDLINSERNPEEAFDRNALFGLTLTLNNILPKIDLSNYPTLQSRVGQSGFTQIEIADFINQSGYSFDQVNFIATDYNNAVTGINTNNSTTGGSSTGISSPTPVAGPVTGYTIGDVASNFQGTLVDNNVSGNFQTGGSFTGQITVENSGPFNGTDGLGNLVSGTFFVGVRPVSVGPLGPYTIYPSNTTTGGILDLLNQLDFYLNENIGSSISAGICAMVNNPFGQLQEVFAQIEAIVEAIAAFLSDPLGFLLGAIGGLVNKLNALASTLKGIVDSLVNSLINQVKNVINQVTSFVQNIEQNAQDMFKKMAEKVRNVQNFFNDATIDKIKEKIQKFVDDAGAQFEDLTPEALALLLFRFCQFSEMLQTFMQRPMQAVRKFATDVDYQVKLLESASSEQTQQMVAAGATRFTDTAIRDSQRRLRSRVNRRAESRRSNTGGGGGGTSPGAPPPPDPQVYISNNELSESERQELLNLGPEGTKAFGFMDSVKNMGKTVSDAGDNDGFARIDPNVFVKLTIVSRRMGKKFNLNSGYRSPEYNSRIGGAKRSMHMTGKAIDVSTRGWSTEEKAEFIRLVSQEGFLGIGTYNTFIHIDIGSRRFWTKGETRFNDYLAMHSRDQFRRGAA